MEESELFVSELDRSNVCDWSNGSDYCPAVRSDTEETRTLVGSALSALSPLYESLKVVGNEECGNDTAHLMESALNLHIPALKMLDATARLPSGLLNGNVNQLGDFDQCLAANGRYCLALIDYHVDNDEIDSLMHAHRMVEGSLSDPGHRISRQSLGSWATCVPQSCRHQDVQKAVGSILQGRLSALEVSVGADFCHAGTDVTPVTYEDIIAWAVLGIIVALVLLAAVIEDGHVENKAWWRRVLAAFYVRANLQTLASTAAEAEDIPGVHLMRFVNMLALLIFHKSVAAMFVPHVNRTAAVEQLQHPWTVIGRTAIVYTDSFIVLSGLLTSYSVIGELDRKKGFSVFGKVCSRVFRLLPNLVATILVSTYVLPRLGSGPLWKPLLGQHAELCRRHMWRNFLFVHNYYGFPDMCLTHTHQLGIDMQLFVAGLPLLYLLWRWPRIGLYSLAAVAGASTVLRAYVTYTQRLSTVIYFGANVSQLFRTADLSYTLPTHRATVYVMGLLLGYALRRSPTVAFSKTRVSAAWVTAATVALLAACGPVHMGRRGYRYSAAAAAAYNALSPLLWGAFVCWVLLAASLGYAGWVGRLAAWPGFRVFSRLSYAIYLTQFPVYFYNIGRTRAPQFYHHTALSTRLCGSGRGWLPVGRQNGAGSPPLRATAGPAARASRQSGCGAALRCAGCERGEAATDSCINQKRRRHSQSISAPLCKLRLSADAAVYDAAPRRAAPRHSRRRRRCLWRQAHPAASSLAALKDLSAPNTVREGKNVSAPQLADK
ncbi:uncharacterized protein LOC124622896 [Schistocerca americana]|uniref:uncharacterized protein LOC124622896 n=1 Tax=Schistocerca americana TaxID=7009 RepID=UPI001F502975|nr:uncharacterized protein LOC124622896 [Schistocerca americana]